MHRSSVNVRKMVMASIFAAMTAACAWISIPVLEIAFTLQTLGILLCLGILGGRWGTVSIGLYLLLGAVGMPVFAGFRGGPGVLLGATGGYLMGFVAAGLIYWLTEWLLGCKPWVRFLGMVLGLLACYAAGTGWFLLAHGPKSSRQALGAVLLSCVVPYLLPDMGKLALAWALTQRLRRHWKN